MFHIYGLVVGIAIVVGWSVAERIEPKVNKVAPLVIGLGLLGARIYHVVDLWDYYSQNMWQIWNLWNGGMSIWGGIIGGGLGWWVSGGDLKILSAMVTGLPLAQAIGRIANGVNGEFVQRVGILPWWGAEALLDLMLFVLLRGSTPKYRIWIYLVCYGLIRLVLQPYRG